MAWDGHLQGIVLTSSSCLEVVCCISHCTMCPPGYCSSSLSSRIRGHPAPCLAAGATGLAPRSGCCHLFCCRRAETGELERTPSGLALRPAPEEQEHRFVSQTSLRKGKESSSLPAPTPHPSPDLSDLIKISPQREREKGYVSSESCVPSVQSSFALKWRKD